jgi:predicted metal-dependent hydrolase
MNLSDEIIEVSNLKVEIKKRDVKNLRIGIIPPLGRVRVTAPLNYDLNLIESVVLKKLKWIRRQQEAMKNQERQTEREAVSGESYFFKGKKYRLYLVDGNSRGKLIIRNNSKMELSITKDSSNNTRLNVIDNFYRKALQDELDILVPKLSKEIGVEIPVYGIRKMKNRWGSCEFEKKKININIDLIKKNPVCLKYIVVHELVHLIEPNHNERFKKLMDEKLGNWRYFRDLLNTAPLSHANWDY